MSYVCPLCSIDPSNHSLVKYKEIPLRDIIYYYSCPSQAKLYFDYEGIINHYTGVLNEIPKNKKWIWIFDSKDFGFKHFIQTDVGIELAKLISSKFSDNLEKIIIINPTLYISATYKILHPFLDKRVTDTIIFDYQYKNVDDILLNTNW